VLTKKDGTSLFGRVQERTVDGARSYEVVVATAEASSVRVPFDDVAKVEAAKLSPMPSGLVDRLSADELADLVAYVMSRGL